MTGARGSDFVAFLRVVLGGVAVAVMLSFFFSPPGVQPIWSDCGWVPTRYLSGDHGGCSFLSHEEANSGPKRTVTSWTQAGMGIGPQPTPLAVGVKWDSPSVPDYHPDPRGWVLVAALAGFGGLTVGMNLGRRREQRRVQ